MRTILVVLILMTGLSLNLSAQDNTLPTRQFKLKIVDKKGRIQKNAVATYSISSFKDMQEIDPSGVTLLNKITDNDTLTFVTPQYVGEVALRGLDSIAIVISNNKIVGSLQADDMSAYPVFINIHRDASKFIYKDLTEYIQYRVPGAKISAGGSSVVLMGGNNSFQAGSAALIVVDGIPCSDLYEANAMVRVETIKSIRILKTEVIYGKRGVNGVLEITTTLHK